MLTLTDEERIFSQAAIFSALPEIRLRQLAFASRRLGFASGDWIFRAGEAAGRGYLILEGQAEVLLPEAGQERKLADVGQSFVLGDGALISGSPYLVSARAVTDLLVLAIARADLLAILDGDSDALGALLKGLSARNAEIEESLSIRLS